MVLEDGIPYVFTKFPGAFKQRFKGPGHELGDLQRFMEMYQQWHKRLYPYKVRSVSRKARLFERKYGHMSPNRGPTQLRKLSYIDTIEP